MRSLRTQSRRPPNVGLTPCGRSRQARAWFTYLLRLRSQPPERGVVPTYRKVKVPSVRISRRRRRIAKLAGEIGPLATCAIKGLAVVGEPTIGKTRSMASLVGFIPLLSTEITESALEATTPSFLRAFYIHLKSHLIILAKTSRTETTSVRHRNTSSPIERQGKYSKNSRAPPWE